MPKQDFTIYNLPDDFSTAKELSAPIIIRPYESTSPSLRNKSIINWNMIDIILVGEKKIIDVFNMPSLKAGELMVLSSGSSLISQALPAGLIFKSLVIYFTNGFLTDFLIKYNHFADAKGDSPRVSFLKYRQDPFIENYVHSLLLAMRCKHIYTPQFKMVKVEELLLYLLNCEPGKLGSLKVIATDNTDNTLRKAVENTIGTKVTIEELAFLCNTSISSFKRRFVKIYGTAPQKWMVQQKMQLAAALLKHPDEHPGTVYDKVGYDNHSSFTKAFKQQYGMAPKVYQQANLGR